MKISNISRRSASAIGARLLATIILCVAALPAVMAKVDRYVDVLVAPECGSWTLAKGKPVSFVVTVIDSNIPAEGTIEYEVSEDLMEPRLTGSATLNNGRATIKAGTMKTPGFLRCRAVYKDDRGTYSGLGTIGFSPEELRPVTANPVDFDEFWTETIADARKVQLHPMLEHLPDKSTPTVDVYRASWSVGPGNARFYGMLAIPKGDGPFPAVVQYPGAGVYAIGANMAFAEKGIISLAFNPHGIAPDLDDKTYNDLGNTALRNYPAVNATDRDNYYYRRMVQGAVRAIDLLENLPECNGRIATYGGSQGGFLSIAVSALHPSVSFCEARFPALSDMSGYLYGRAGGWPHLLKDKDKVSGTILAHSLAYYDTANFARRLKVPVQYAFGFNDMTCAPTTTYSVYNVITSPKTLSIAPLMGHNTTDEQWHGEIAAVVKALTE